MVPTLSVNHQKLLVMLFLTLTLGYNKSGKVEKINK